LYCLETVDLEHPENVGNLLKRQWPWSFTTRDDEEQFFLGDPPLMSSSLGSIGSLDSIWMDSSHAVAMDGCRSWALESQWDARLPTRSHVGLGPDGREMVLLERGWRGGDEFSNPISALSPLNGWGGQVTPRGELDAGPGFDGTLVLRLRPSVDGYNGLATGCGI
jgi:hypothetical protein